MLVNKFRAEKNGCLDGNDGTWHIWIADGVKMWEECFGELGMRKRVYWTSGVKRKHVMVEEDSTLAANPPLWRSLRLNKLPSSKPTNDSHFPPAKKRKPQGEEKEEKQKKAKKFCCFPGCDGNNLTSKLKCVPAFPAKLRPNATEARHKKHRIAEYRRREWMDRLRLGRVGKGQKVIRKTHRNHRKQAKNIEDQDLRVCVSHVTDWTTPKSVT